MITAKDKEEIKRIVLKTSVKISQLEETGTVNASDFINVIRSNNNTYKSRRITIENLLKAAREKYQDEKIIELGQKIDGLALGKFYGFFPAAADLPAGDEPGYVYVGASSPFAIYVFKDGAWSDSGSVFKPSEGNGEDIDTNAQGKLQFVNRPTTYGMGYVILRRNKTFSEQVTLANTIYEIRYDFALDAEFTMPSNCVLYFVGGSIEASAPIHLNGAHVFGDGTIRAAAGYSHPYLIEISGGATIENVNIDLGGNAIVAVRSTTNVNADFVQIFNGLIISNGGRDTEVASISSISGNVVTTASAHGLQDNDFIQIYGVVGGQSTNQPTLSVWNNLFFVKVIDSTSFKIYWNNIESADEEALFDNYTPYSSGGKIDKISCGISLLRSHLYADINNVSISGCDIGVYVASWHNNISNLKYISAGANSISVQFCFSVRETNMVDSFVDAPIVCRTGVHRLVMERISSLLAFDAPAFDIWGINAGNGRAGGEVESIIIKDCTIRGYCGDNAVIHSDGHSLQLCGIEVTRRTAEDALLFFDGLATKATFKNIVFSGGGDLSFCEDAILVSTIFENISRTQHGASIGALTAFFTRASASDDNGYNVLRNILSFNVLASASSYGRIIFENISGTLDLTNIIESLVINCPNITNNDASAGNTILQGGTKTVAYKTPPTILNNAKSAGLYPFEFFSRNTTYKRAIGTMRSGQAFGQAAIKIEMSCLQRNICCFVRAFISIQYTLSSQELAVKMISDKTDVRGADAGVEIKVFAGNSSTNVLASGVEQTIANVSAGDSIGVSIKNATSGSVVNGTIFASAAGGFDIL